MGEKIRAFVAIHLPESVLHAIGKAQDRLRRCGFDIRWVRKEGIHLTLKFLGDIERDTVNRVRAAMEESAKGCSAFNLQGQGLGVFPNARRPRVVWVGIAGEVAALFALQGRLESELEAIGFARDKRRFRGHLTLGRVKGRLDTHRFMKAMEELGPFETGSFCVESVALFQSTLRPQGAVYSKLAKVRLGDV